MHYQVIVYDEAKTKGRRPASGKGEIDMTKKNTTTKTTEKKVIDVKALEKARIAATRKSVRESLKDYGMASLMENWKQVKEDAKKLAKSLDKEFGASIVYTYDASDAKAKVQEEIVKMTLDESEKVIMLACGKARVYVMADEDGHAMIADLKVERALRKGYEKRSKNSVKMDGVIDKALADFAKAIGLVGETTNFANHVERCRNKVISAIASAVVFITENDDDYKLPAWYREVKAA